MSNKRTKLALVDDHKLFRKGLISLIEMATAGSAQIIFEADNGADMVQKLEADNVPDIVLMDINMPHMDGFETVGWLAQHYPGVHVLVVSMIDKEDSIVRMLRLGVKGYLSKDVEPAILNEAITTITAGNYYYTDFVTGRLIHTLVTDAGRQEQRHAMLNAREKEFIQWACSELTYNEIALKMFASPKTIDSYRASLFEKLGVKSRVGLALYAVRSGLVGL